MFKGAPEGHVLETVSLKYYVSPMLVLQTSEEVAPDLASNLYVGLPLCSISIIEII